MAAYIKFDGIDGEVVTVGFEKWVMLETFTQGCDTSVASGMAGTKRQRGSVQFHDISISKVVDSSTPKLQEAVSIGKVFPKVEIQLTSTKTGDSQKTYFAYELKDVMVTSHHIGGGGQDIPMESLSLNFEEIKVTYVQTDKGSKKGNVAYGWSINKAAKA